jgi:hypothetical protein
MWRFTPEFFGSQTFPAPPFATFNGLFNPVESSQYLLGDCPGGFEARTTVHEEQTRPWLTAGVERATEAPYLLHRYGSLWVDFRGGKGFG